MQQINKLNEVSLQPKSDGLEIVTSDVERQFSPTRKTEVVSIAPSGPVQTAPRGNKPVSKLKLKLEKESVSIYRKETWQ